jgi:hypothetical protein
MIYITICPPTRSIQSHGSCRRSRSPYSVLSDGSQTSTAPFQPSAATILSSSSLVLFQGTPNFPLLILHILTSPICSSALLTSSNSICIAGAVFLTMTSGLSLPLPYFALVNLTIYQYSPHAFLQNIAYRHPIQCPCRSAGGIKSAVPVGTGLLFKRCSFVQKVL